jgi:hypothetical protein
MANGRPGAPKGHPKFGGRVAGTKNRATREREQRLVQALVAEQLTPEQQAEIMPLHVMLRIMRARDRAGDDAGALAAAIAAAPYCHCRLTAADLHVTSEDSRLSDEQLREAIEEVQQKLAAARVLN